MDSSIALTIKLFSNFQIFLLYTDMCIYMCTYNNFSFYIHVLSIRLNKN